MSGLLLPALAAPLGVALLLALGTSGRALAVRLAPLAGLPALALAILLPLSPDPSPVAEHTWLLLGGRFCADPPAQAFLMLSALLWSACGLYASSYLAGDQARHRFFLYFLLAMSGNFTLVLAADALTFYTGFGLMTFAAYGLVIHTGSRDALRAGRIYIIMAIAGEGALLAGLMLAVSAAGTTDLERLAAGVAAARDRDLIAGLLLAGFGIKAGAVPLHVWLPLAHPVAPTPASAVLSGSMIKAGLLGWLRFLPLGHEAMVGWGTVVIALSGVAAVAGVLVGLTQRDSKTVLAYSSVSQIGFLGVIVGVGVARPEMWPPAFAAAVLYALHHGLIKGALFLGVGVARVTGEGKGERRAAMILLSIGAIALAGAPFTTGALAKTAVVESLKGGAGGLAPSLIALFKVSAIGTTALMGRFLWVVGGRELSRRPGRRGGLWFAFAGLTAAAFAVVWAAPGLYRLPIQRDRLLALDSLWGVTWPVAAGLLLLVGFHLARARLPERLRELRIPAGDLLLAIEWIGGRLRFLVPRGRVPDPDRPLDAPSARWYGILPGSRPGDLPSRWSASITRFDVAGPVFLATLLLLAALWIGG